MPKIEVMVEIKAKKYYIIDAETQKEAREWVEELFNDDRPRLNGVLRMLEGIFLDKGAKFVVPRVKR